MNEDQDGSGFQNLLWARALAHGFVSSGVTHAVVSPGSRNTPVLLALEELQQESKLETHLVLDERTAAFVALGIARMTGNPTLLSCTSGSAAANYFPAIVEARQDGLPLIVLTADRPPERHGVGDGQTMPQQRLFGDHVAAFYDVGTPHPDAPVQVLANLAVRAAVTARAEGPVQINLPFRKPLWEPEASRREGRSLPTAPTIVSGPPALSPSQLDEVAGRLEAAGQGILVVGPGDLPGPRRQSAVAFGNALQGLAEKLGWPILVEAASATTFTDTPHLMRGADLLFRTRRAGKAVEPDLVVRFGQLPSSRPTFEWLASLKAEQILVDPRGRWNDPDLLASTLLVAAPTQLCRALTDRIAARPKGNWLERVTTLDGAACAAAEHAGSEDDVAWGASVAHTVLQNTPPGVAVHVASSLAVRDIDSFGGPNAARRLVTASRGVNGIDGTIATAFGQHLADPGEGTLCWLGDLAALHDIGSLLTLSAQYPNTPPFVVMIVDNDGGGIFDHLPIKSHPSFEKLFITPQAAADGLPETSKNGLRVRDTDALGTFLRRSIETPGVHLVVVDVDRATDLSRRERLQARLESRLGSLKET